MLQQHPLRCIMYNLPGGTSKLLKKETDGIYWEAPGGHRICNKPSLASRNKPSAWRSYIMMVMTLITKQNRIWLTSQSEIKRWYTGHNRNNKQQQQLKFLLRLSMANLIWARTFQLVRPLGMPAKHHAHANLKLCTNMFHPSLFFFLPTQPSRHDECITRHSICS